MCCFIFILCRSICKRATRPFRTGFVRDIILKVRRLWRTWLRTGHEYVANAVAMQRKRCVTESDYSQEHEVSVYHVRCSLDYCYMLKKDAKYLSPFVKQQHAASATSNDYVSTIVALFIFLQRCRMSTRCSAKKISIRPVLCKLTSKLLSRLKAQCVKSVRSIEKRDATMLWNTSCICYFYDFIEHQVLIVVIVSSFNDSFVLIAFCLYYYFYRNKSAHLQ